MDYLYFPIALSTIGVGVVAWMVLKHHEFIEGFRRDRAAKMVLHVAENAKKSFIGYARIILLAVVIDGDTVLLGYKPTDDGFGFQRAEYSPTSVHRPGAGETMVAWWPVNRGDFPERLDDWCTNRTEIYMNIDTTRRMLTLSDVELHSVVELALSPVVR